MKTKQNILKNTILVLLLFTGIAKAQIVNIPDPNFKAKCIFYGVDTNADGEIQVSEAASITGLNVSSGNISDLTGISAFVNLRNLLCDTNVLTSLDLSGLTALTVVHCNGNQLTSLNLNGLVNLQTLQCTDNQLAAIDLTGLNSLRLLYCYNNQLTNIDVSGLSSLISLQCEFNQLTTIDVSNLPNFKFLNCNNNLISSINLTGITELWILHCEFNQLTTLDLSGVTNYDVFVDCSNNNLFEIYIKNGRNVALVTSGPYCQCSGNMYFFNNPNLAYVCCDVDEVSSIEALSGTGNYSNFVTNTYCSFIPGGNYNTITGNITYDADNNGCDAFDPHASNVRFNINDGTNQGAVFTNGSGNYTFYTQAGSFDITQGIENPAWFNFSPPTVTIPFADNNNNTATQDFCITANGVHPDVEIVIVPINRARPGFDAKYLIVYKNKGNQTMSGNITFTYDDTILDFVNASITPDTQNVGLLNWNYIDLLPFENRSFYVTLNVNSAIETPAVNIGDILQYEATITPVIGDENGEDNLFSYHETVIGSYDPNDITCIEGAVVPSSEIGNYLHYVINFENTGTFSAENIVVKTEVDASQFDIGSLQLMNASDPVDARITGNKVEFIFENIQLPIGGHGHILLKIKTKNTLVTGDAVAKRADIFFDYNAPVDTGFANTVFQNLSNTNFEIDSSVVVSPNPAVNEVNVKADNTIKSMALYDVQGRIISTSLVNETESKLDIASYSKGIYFIKITTEKGIKVQKLLKH